MRHSRRGGHHVMVYGKEGGREGGVCVSVCVQING